jgi:ribosome-binding protein aMBF1 (putative translation factor)
MLRSDQDFADEEGATMNAKSTETSPTGATIAHDHDADYRTSAEYRAEWDRQAVAFAVATAVHQRRTELGLSQGELATRVGTTGSVISRIESGRHYPSMTTLQRIASALDTRLVVRFEERPLTVPLAMSAKPKRLPTIPEPGTSPLFAPETSPLSDGKTAGS